MANYQPLYLSGGRYTKTPASDFLISGGLKSPDGSDSITTANGTVTVADAVVLDSTLELGGSMNMDSQGATSVGSLAGVTTIGSSGAATLDSGGNGSSFGGALTVTGTVGGATGSTFGNLTLANGSITDSGGSISFGDENLSNTGTVDFGAATLDSLNNSSGGITNAGSIAGATSIDGSGDLTMGTITMTGFSVDSSGDLACQNLTVNGTTTTVEGTTVVYEDSLFLMGKDQTGASPALDFGIIGERGDIINCAMFFDESDGDTWKFVTTTDTGTATAISNITDYLPIRAGAITSDDGVTISAGGLDINGGAIDIASGGMTNVGSIAGATTVDASGAITGGTITDGTGSMNGGALTGLTTLTMASGTATLTDLIVSGGDFTVTAAGAATMTDLVVSAGDFQVTAGGAVTAASVTDGTATLTSGDLTGLTTLTMDSGTATLTDLIVSGGDFTVTAAGAVTTAAACDLGATTVDSLNASNGGITNAGAVSGATTVAMGGALTGVTDLTASGTCQITGTGSLAIGGATIGTHDLAVTGTSHLIGGAQVASSASRVGLTDTVGCYSGYAQVSSATASGAAVYASIDNTSGTNLSSGSYSAYLAQLEDKATDSGGTYIAFSANNVVDNSGAASFQAFSVGTGFDVGLSISSGTLIHAGGEIDLDPTGVFSLDMDAGNAVTITLADMDNAMVVQAAGGEDLIALSYSAGTKAVDFGNATDNPDYAFLGSGDVGIDGTLSLASGSSVSSILDEDAMGSDSATALATQQSIKAYVDAQVGGYNTLSEMNDTDIAGLADAHMLFYNNGAGNWENSAMSGDATISNVGVITFTATNTNLTTLANVVEVGALDAGSITSGFGTIIVDGMTASEASPPLSIDSDRHSGTGGLVVNLSMDNSSGVTGEALGAAEYVDVAVLLTKGNANDATGSLYRNIVLETDGGDGGNAGFYGIHIDSGFDKALHIDSGSFDFNGSDIDLDPSGTFALDMAATKTVTVSLSDNLADAFLIQQGSDAYLDITTSNTTEHVWFGNATTNPDYSFLGSGTLSLPNAALSVDGDTTLSGTLILDGASKEHSISGDDAVFGLGDGVALDFGDDVDASISWVSGFLEMTMETGGKIRLSENASSDPLPIATNSYVLTVLAESGSATPTVDGTSVIDVDLDNSAGTALTSGEIAGLHVKLSGHASDSGGVYEALRCLADGTGSATKKALYVGSNFDVALDIDSGTVDLGSGTVSADGAVTFSDTLTLDGASKEHVISGTSAAFRLNDGVALDFGTDADVTLEWANTESRLDLLVSTAGTTIALAEDESQTPVALGASDKLLTVYTESGSATPSDATALRGLFDNSAGTALTSGSAAAVEGYVKGHASDSSGIIRSFHASTGGDAGGSASLVGIHIDSGFDTGVRINSGGIVMTGGAMELMSGGTHRITSGSLRLEDSIELTFGDTDDGLIVWDDATQSMQIDSGGGAAPFVFEFGVGETVAAYDAVYYSAADSEVKLANAGAAGTKGVIGYMLESGVDTDVGKKVAVGGIVTVRASGTVAVGDQVYLSDTNGRIASSAGTNEVIAGTALTGATDGNTFQMVVCRTI